MRAAGAAAMAKLDLAQGKGGAQPLNANLQQRINDMRDDQANRGGPSYRGRGRGFRGGRARGTFRGRGAVATES